MIQTFCSASTRDLFVNKSSRAWGTIASAALRKLDYLEAASTLGDLRSPPGNNLEALKGDRTGKYSIRINQQWRLCFRWESDGAYDVEIVDYH